MDKKQIIQQLRDRRYSFQKIGDLLGISRQRVHQILNRQILNRIPYHRKGLQGCDRLAEKVRKRDNWTCQICGKVWEKGTRRFDVHHTNPENESIHTYSNYKKFDEMITLCHKCHMNLDHVRKKTGRPRKEKITLSPSNRY